MKESGKNQRTRQTLQGKITKNNLSKGKLAIKAEYVVALFNLGLYSIAQKSV